jgi:hypothetical protein
MTGQVTVIGAENLMLLVAEQGRSRLFASVNATSTLQKTQPALSASRQGFVLRPARFARLLTCRRAGWVTAMRGMG